MRTIIVILLNCLLIKSTFTSNNIVFDLADLTVDYPGDYGIINLEAFKSSLNDLIIEQKQTTKYGQLNWLSIGNPTLIRAPKSNGSFTLQPYGFDIYVDMLTQSQRTIFKDLVKRKYDIDVKEEQIVSLTLAKFACQIELYTSNGDRVLLSGQVTELNRYPLKVIFKAPVNSKERTLFEQRLNADKENLDLDIVCELSSQGKAYVQNTLIISGSQISQLGIVDKIFGVGSEAFVSRNQVSQLVSELYLRLNVVEDYQIPETTFKESFINDFLTQTSTQIFQFTDIDKALAQMSKYNFMVDIAPSVIKSEMSKIFAINKTKSTETLVVNQTQYDRLVTTYGKNTGGSASGSFLGFKFGGSASYATQQSSDWTRQNTSFTDQLSQLNTYYESEVQWARQGNIIVPKSVDVSKLSKAYFSKDLVFSRVRREYYDAPYKRILVLSTLNKLFTPSAVTENAQRLARVEQSVIDANKQNQKNIDDLRTAFNNSVKSVSDKTDQISSDLIQFNKLTSANISIMTDSLRNLSTQIINVDSYSKTGLNRIVQGKTGFYKYPNDMGENLQTVSFGVTFKNPPFVIVSYQSIDSATPLRTNIEWSNVNTNGFTFKVTTWSGTKIYGVYVVWTAFGIV